jgi:hypothetical protein
MPCLAILPLDRFKLGEPGGWGTRRRQPGSAHVRPALPPCPPPRTPSPLGYGFAGSGTGDAGPLDGDRVVWPGRVVLWARGRVANRQPGPTRER